MSTEEQKIARIRELKAEIAAITIDYDAEINRLEDLLALKKSIAGTATESRAVSSEKPTEKFEKCNNLLAYYRLCERIEGMLSPEDHKLVEAWILFSARHNASKDGKVVPLHAHASLMEFQSHRVRDVLLKYIGRGEYEGMLQFALLMLKPWRFAEDLLQVTGIQQLIERVVSYQHLRSWSVSTAEFWNVLYNIVYDLRTTLKDKSTRQKIDGLLSDLHSYYGFDMSCYYLGRYQAA
jgi:hypothetical protein